MNLKRILFNITDTIVQCLLSWDYTNSYCHIIFVIAISSSLYYFCVWILRSYLNIMLIILSLHTINKSCSNCSVITTCVQLNHSRPSNGIWTIFNQFTTKNMISHFKTFYKKKKKNKVLKCEISDPGFSVIVN